MIATRQLARIQLPDGAISVVATWDSPALEPETGNPEYSGAIISIVATNTSPTRTANVLIKRGNGTAVVQRSLPPLATETYTGGGPVRNVEDIPNFMISVK